MGPCLLIASFGCLEIGPCCGSSVPSYCSSVQPRLFGSHRYVEMEREVLARAAAAKLHSQGSYMASVYFFTFENERDKSFIKSSRISPNVTCI